MRMGGTYSYERDATQDAEYDDDPATAEQYRE